MNDDRDARVDAALRRWLDGRVAAPIAAMELLTAAASVDGVRAALARAAASVPDELARERLERMRRLVDDNAEGCEAVVGMLRDGLASPATARTADEALAVCRRLFDGSVARSEEASVALYSLGSPAILAAATAEIVDLFERWGVVGSGRRALEIGCGIGRVVCALAPRVAEIVGVDLSPGMIAAAERRARGLGNVHLYVTNGRDLARFADSSFELVYAVDVLPYVVLAGAELVDAHFAEAARVLVDGGELAVANFSYGGDLGADRRDVAALAVRHGFAVRVDAARPFSSWDGVAWRLTRRDRSGRIGTTG